jgi:hypothetical protein
MSGSGTGTFPNSEPELDWNSNKSLWFHNTVRKQGSWVRVRDNDKESRERILTKERGVFLVAKFKISDADEIR